MAAITENKHRGKKAVCLQITQNRWIWQHSYWDNIIHYQKTDLNRNFKNESSTDVHRSYGPWNIFFCCLSKNMAMFVKHSTKAWYFYLVNSACIARWALEVPLVCFFTQNICSGFTNKGIYYTQFKELFPFIFNMYPVLSLLFVSF